MLTEATVPNRPPEQSPGPDKATPAATPPLGTSLPAPTTATSAPAPIEGPVQTPAAGTAGADIPLHQLMQAAAPLWHAYLDSQAKAHERQLAFESTQLEHTSRQQRTLAIVGAVLLGIVLAFAGYLVTQGRDALASDLVKLILALVSVGFGGWGLASARQSRRAPRDD